MSSPKEPGMDIQTPVSSLEDLGLDPQASTWVLVGVVPDSPGRVTYHVHVSGVPLTLAEVQRVLEGGLEAVRTARNLAGLGGSEQTS